MRGLHRVLGLLLVLALAPATRADLIFLKDGTVLHGKLRRENTAFKDPVSGEVYNVARGFFFIDDGARRFFFASGQLGDVQPDFLPNQDTVMSPKKVILVNSFRLPPILDVLETSPFDDKWNRTIKFQGPDRAIHANQHLSILNSYHARLDSTRDFHWASFYLTQELGYDTVRKLLIDHPDFADPTDLPVAQRSARRFRLYHFLVHADFLNQAEAELDRIAKDLPSEIKKVEEAREKLAKLQNRKHLEAIRKAHAAGRRKWVAEQFPIFTEKHATPKGLEEVRSLKAAYESADAKLKEARSLFLSLRGKLTGPEKQSLTPALLAIEAELHADAIGRLDLFLEQARSAAKQEKTRGKSDQSAAELLSLAITGWLLGGASAEAKVETALRAWRGRELVLRYVNAVEGARPNLLPKSPADKELPTVDQMVQLLAYLPALKPDDKLPTGISEQKTAAGTSYLLQLPAEYHHGRPYPVLLVLHNSSDEPKEMMERWAKVAAQEGYILAAPSWSQGLGGAYAFSAAEHDTVLETLKDLRTRFNVDSDRVFLFGLGQGGTMALDVGLSHPDQFAGVLPMCAYPRYYCREYFSNGQYLPLYFVSGEWMGDSSLWTKELLEKLITKSYPAMHVMYRGRGVEWFGGEVPSMFEWMSRKRRLLPTTQLGSLGEGGEFISMRVSENRFYWLTSEGIEPRRLNAPPPNWKNRFPGATMQAYVKPDTNQIAINQRGHTHMTVWLARNAGFDFDKPIEVKMNGVMMARRKLTPSLATLLEDFAQRFDRQRLFVAKVSF